MRENSAYTVTLRLAAFGPGVQWQETGKREVEEVRRARQRCCRDESSETLSGRDVERVPESSIAALGSARARWSSVSGVSAPAIRA